MAYEINGETFDADEEGYIIDISNWNEGLADLIAADEKIEMTEEHWEVVNFLREYYDEYQIAPAVRVLTKAIGKKIRQGKRQQQIPVCPVPLRSCQAGL